MGWQTARSFSKQHLIPNDPKLCQPDAFPDFVEARKALCRTLSNGS
jgi:hypothetical protein